MGLAAAFRESLPGADDAGRLPAASALALRARLDASGAEAPKILQDVESLLGPFDALPPAVRSSLVRELEEDERRRLWGYGLGDWHRVGVRALRSPRAKRWTKNLSHRMGVLLREGPRRTRYALHRAAAVREGLRAARPTVGSLLRARGIDPLSLIVWYARGLAQPAPYRGFWHDPKRNVTVASILGVDLLPSAEGLWYLESNLNSALRPARTALYEKVDPYVANIFRFAQQGGYRRVVVVFGNNHVLATTMAERFERESAERKIEITLLEDAYLPRSRHPQTFGIPEPLEPDTLVVRMKLYHSNLDHVIHNKRACQKVLAIYTARTGDRDVLLPPTSDDPVASEYDAGRPFPNLVYKLPELDLGLGVVFLKAASLENAREMVTREMQRRRPEKWSERLNATASHLFDDHRGVFQPYIVGKMLEGRRLYYVRSHVMITPVGPQFLSAHRIVCAHPVPGELRDGIVRDRKPYFWSFDKGATFELIPPEEEEERTVAATLSVARGLSAAAAYSFDTGPA